MRFSLSIKRVDQKHQGSTRWIRLNRKRECHYTQSNKTCIVETRLSKHSTLPTVRESDNELAHLKCEALNGAYSHYPCWSMIMYSTQYKSGCGIDENRVRKFGGHPRWWCSKVCSAAWSELIMAHYWRIGWGAFRSFVPPDIITHFKSLHPYIAVPL